MYRAECRIHPQHRICGQLVRKHDGRYLGIPKLILNAVEIVEGSAFAPDGIVLFSLLRTFVMRIKGRGCACSNRLLCSRGKQAR